MTKVSDIAAAIEDFAPLHLQEDYDNAGLQIGDPGMEVSGVLLCLDVTEEALDEALRRSCNMVVSHHPLIFRGLKQLTGRTDTERIAIRALRDNVAIYSAHTNLDFVRDGINDYVAQILGLHNVTSLEPYIDGETGYGRVGDLSNKVFSSVFKGEVETVLHDAYVRTVGEPYAQVKRVAVINGGSGGDTKYVDMAIKAGADCLVTADVKHHVAVYALESGITLIEPQHFTMEHCYIARLVQYLKIEAKARKSGVEILQSQAEHNPRY